MDNVKNAITEIQKLMEPEGDEGVPKAPPPEQNEVLYSEPVLGGIRRNCSNCVLWASGNRCSVMEGSVEATADHICGHHIYGTPSKDGKSLAGMTPLNPKFTGFTLAKGGVACDTCDHYTPVDDEEGVCAAVVKRKKPLHTHPKALCARWTRKLPPTDPKAP